MAQTLNNASYSTDPDSLGDVHYVGVGTNADVTDDNEEGIRADHRTEEAGLSDDHQQDGDNDHDSEEEEGGPQQAGAGSSMSAEPDSSTQRREFVSREDYQAALLIVCFRESGTPSTQAPEPPDANANTPPSERNAHPALSQAQPEPPAPGSVTSTKSTKSKKRRRKGPRLTHVKNGRAKKANARAEAAIRTDNAGDRVPDASRSTRSRMRNQPQPTRTANDAPRRLTRSTARTRANESAGQDQKAGSSKGKGREKETVSGELDSDGAAKNLKRRRSDSEDDQAAHQGEPGPSKRHRPTQIADEAPHRLTRSAARAQAIKSSEQEQQAEPSKEKGKEKETAKDEPESDEAATNSKRRRCDSEDDGDELDVLEALGEPGPSTHGKRQKLESNTDNSGEPSDPAVPDVRSGTPHSETADSQSGARGIKRARSLAPEPSDDLIETERKRFKRETPERGGFEPPATSSRAQPENTTGDQPTSMVKEEGPENETSQGDPVDVSTARPRYISEVQGVPRLRYRPRSDRLERQETTIFGNQLLRPADIFYYRR